MKNVFIFLLIALCAAMAWHIFSQPTPPPKTIEKTVTKYVQLEVERLNKSKDEKGIETTIMEETEHILTAAGAKSATDSAKIIDSLQKLANGLMVSYTQAQAEIKRRDVAMQETDTSYQYRDKWLSVDVIKPGGGKPPRLNSTYNMELNWMWYNERRRFFGIPWSTKTYGRFWPNDPNATISGLKHVRIEPPVKRFGLALMAVGEYYHDDVLFGAGVSVDIGRLRLQGNYLRDFSSGRWYPAFRGGFKLIDIK